MKFENIKLDIYEKHYALVTICREQVSNALNEKTVCEIQTALNIISENNLLRAVIITGEGNKCFSAGADLEKMQKKTALDILQSTLQDLCLRIEKFKIPIIAAVNGYALGGGMELALSCDFRIATTNAVFGLPEVKLGLIPSAGGTQRLSYLLGVARAKQIIMLGDKLNATQARELGLVYDVVEKENLITAAEQIIDKILHRSPFATYLAKLSINMATNAGNESGMRYEKMCQAVLASHSDREEGIKAFYEKRLPKYNMFE